MLWNKTFRHSTTCRVAAIRHDSFLLSSWLQSTTKHRVVRSCARQAGAPSWKLVCFMPKLLKRIKGRVSLKENCGLHLPGRLEHAVCICLEVRDVSAAGGSGARAFLSAGLRFLGRVGAWWVPQRAQGAADAVAGVRPGMRQRRSRTSASEGRVGSEVVWKGRVLG